MKKILFLFFCACLTGFVRGQSNDHIFPASPAAKKYIDFDQQGFMINGKKTFIVSAGMEYARIPHQLWQDRLLRLKRAGFNCIEIYTFWNFHEPLEGKFNFEGDHDLNAFLKVIRQMDMYAIVRVGPYYCAEWDFGGYPIWLRFKDNLVVRKPNAEFEKYVDRFFDQLMPIVNNNQINKGGSVILVQLENEHPAGWGTPLPNEYFVHLQQKALVTGLEVPYFFSGLHHGSDPAGNKDKPFTDPNRPNPWFTTEFWSVWYNYYGSNQKDADTYGRRTWKIIAHGGGGYNYYMAHGGTNFGYTNDNEDAASYDYGAAVGQTGDLRPIYYQFKRNALFARSFQSILSSAVDEPNLYKKIVADTASIKVSARHSEAGDIVFLDNPGKNELKTQLVIDGQRLPSKGAITLAPGEIMPMVRNFELTPGISIDWAAARILGVANQGNMSTLVVYGVAASNAELKFSTNAGSINIIDGEEAFTTAAKSAVLKVVFNDSEPMVYSLKAGNKTVRILAVSTQLADRTWFADLKGKRYVIIGPEYVGDITEDKNGLKITTEHFWEQKQRYPTWLYDDAVPKQPIKPQPLADHKNTLSINTPWNVKDASASTRNFDDSKWTNSNTALQMGADNDLSCYAWYRTIINVQSTGPYVFKASGGGDRALLYVDDIRVGDGDIHEEIFIKQLVQGKHMLAVFTSHAGRDKLYNYQGAIKDKDAKGLSGNVVLQKGPISTLNNWKVIKANNREELKTGVPSFNNALPYKIGDDAFDRKKGFAWFQADIVTEDNKAPQSLYVKNLPDKSVIFINGKEANRMEDNGHRFVIPLAGKCNKNGKNTITIFMENNRDGRKWGITDAIEVITDSQVNMTLTNWRMQGGPGNYDVATGWVALKAGNVFDRPTFYKSTFNVNDINTGSNAIWRVTFEGLGHGSIWINGHNLGRYPEKIPVKSLYIPECWLVKGTNSIVIYDEDGKRPDKVAIEAEKVASRDIENITF